MTDRDTHDATQHVAPPDARQTQFLTVITRDEATARFQRHLRLAPLAVESVPLSRALHRVLADDIAAYVDVPGFDRSNVDGFAVQAADTHDAAEETPRTLALDAEVLAPGVTPRHAVASGRATMIATGGMVPRGADAVAMVEHTEPVDDGRRLEVSRPLAPGDNVSFAGTDIAKGETVLRAGQLLTSREIGVLAAIGRADVSVYCRPRVAIISTGNELVAPGAPLPIGAIYDSNAATIAAAVEELGCTAVQLGIVADTDDAVASAVQDALAYDVVVLSGGTSKGAGDLSYRVVSRLGNPGLAGGDRRRSCDASHDESGGADCEECLAHLSSPCPVPNLCR